MKDPKLWLAAELPKLVEKKIIPAESATALRGYYALDTPTQTQRVAVILCSILGGTLIGAGIILLIAHNWEDMGRPMRTVLSILPLIGACFISGWAVLRKPASDALNESAGIFHLLSIGAAISLVSQTYHISGDFSDFILIWSLLGLPLIYLLRSTATALLYLAGITVWAGSRMDNHANMLYYWPMAVAVLPFYGQLLRQNRVSIRANWLSLGLGVSVPFALGFQCNDLLEKNWFLLFSGYFTLLYLLDRYWFQEKVITFHPFRFIGAGGIAVLTIAFSRSSPRSEIRSPVIRMQ